MVLKKVIPVDDAIAVVHDGDVLATTGYGGNGTPEALLVALERRFLATGAPHGLSLIYAGGQGDGAERGLNHLPHEGLLRRVVGGHYGLVPKIARLVLDGRVEAYNLPEGVITHLYRDIGARKPGTLSRVGLGTFVDPRLGGGKMNAATTEDLVRVMDIDGEEYLFFRAFPIDVAFIRGATADPDGNVTMEKEALILENLAMAIAAKNCGGYVICQVERVAMERSLDSRDVRIPGILVDCVVVAEPEHHMQTYGTVYNPAFSREIRVPLQTLPSLPLDERKVIARRAALELAPNSVVTLGIGLPEALGRLAGEERIHDLITLTVDPGIFGGVPVGGLDFGAAVNSDAVIDHGSQFDFVDGGGLDSAYLGMAECDREGNVNVSRFADRLAGCGGFINVAQNTKKVVYLGTFSSGGLAVRIRDGQVAIEREGRFVKFVHAVGQITFSGAVAVARGQTILYVTERCVFRLGPAGLVLIEVAPGVDVERDVLRHLPFQPAVEGPAVMYPAIFRPEPLRLRDRMLDLHIDDRLSYDRATNTVYMNYAGMRVRTEADLRVIKDAVDRLLGPLGHRVDSVVNYDRFVADDDIIDQYMDLVKYVEERYYLKVSRYTSSGFLRLKLGRELERRQLSSRVFARREEAGEDAGSGANDPGRRSG